MITFAEDLFIGNTVVLFSRSLKIVNYGDEFTRNNLSNSSESTFALIKPDGFGQIGLILRSLEEAEFTLARAKMVQLGRHQVKKLKNQFLLVQNIKFCIMCLRIAICFKMFPWPCVCRTF